VARPADPGPGHGRRPDPRDSLRADCSRCFALCCVVPAFTASADFALTKAAGAACPNLAAGDRCTIHPQLRDRGFAGCTAYDCFGAGQQVSQVTFGGRDPRAGDGPARLLAGVFPAVRAVHEMLWYLTEALTLTAAAPLRDAIAAASARIEVLASGGPAELAGLDPGAVRRDAGPLLEEGRRRGQPHRSPRVAGRRSCAVARTCLGRICAAPTHGRSTCAAPA
jgi:hypothetical protein